MQKLELNPKPTINKQPIFLLATYLHHIIDARISVAHHHTHRYMVAYITSSNQYPLVWFKTHSMTTWGQIF